ncbi:hypothetical protein AB0P12_09930 [Streptomyces subrutilus]|uniref:hypothetical protein n=1 Tax=Streptomyces subrutilus TaxID=36818 RepID=UPI00341816BB
MPLLIGVLSLSAVSPPWRDAPARGFVAVAVGVLFCWWYPWLLLGGRVPWTAPAGGGGALVGRRVHDERGAARVPARPGPLTRRP